MSLSRIYFSADEDFLSAATVELRDVFPEAKFGVGGPDLGFIEGDGVSIANVASIARGLETPIVFVRHLMRGVGETALPTTIEELATVIPQALAGWQQFPVPASVSLQVWGSGSEPPELPVRMDELWHLLADSLRDNGIDVARAGRDHILSACVTPSGIVLGSNQRGNAMSDWPGGRVRLSKPKGQISRSEFKLEELLRSHKIKLPEGAALDLGASPGGWTRILREHKLMVWAVDPADLDPRIAGDRGVKHVRTTAGTFLHDTDRTFDLVVNDMRMTPPLSCELMLSASGLLNPGGMMIQTLKISPHHGLDMVRQSLHTLRRRYDLDFVRQLQHNRNEVTVVAHHRG